MTFCCSNNNFSFELRASSFYSARTVIYYSNHCWCVTFAIRFLTGPLNMFQKSLFILNIGKFAKSIIWKSY